MAGHKSSAFEWSDTTVVVVVVVEVVRVVLAVESAED